MRKKNRAFGHGMRTRRDCEHVRPPDHSQGHVCADVCSCADGLPAQTRAAIERRVRLALGRHEPFGVSPILRLDDLGKSVIAELHVAADLFGHAAQQAGVKQTVITLDHLLRAAQCGGREIG